MWTNKTFWCLEVLSCLQAGGFTPCWFRCHAAPLFEIAGTTANGHFFGIGFYTRNFYFQEQEVNLMAWRSLQLVFSRRKNKLGAQLLFSSWKNKLGEAPTYFSWGKEKFNTQLVLFAAKIKVVKTFMASNLLFIIENKSWGYKIQSWANSKELWSQAIPKRDWWRT